MPDVSRSDSQRSDVSQRPRVSFNRDVHVKRIGNPGTPRVVGALAGDGEGHLVPLPVRRERPTRLSRRELAKEAERVLQQADSVECTSSHLPDVGRRTKYSTLPPLRSRGGRRRPKLLHSSPSSSPEPGKVKPPRRNLVVSIFSSLDRARPKKSYSDNEGKTSLKKTSSTSLSDLLQTSSSSPERSGDTRTRGTKLARSASDSRKAPRGQHLVKPPDFSSLGRKSKNRAKNNSDEFPSPPPRRNRKHAPSKSHSDSESPTHLLAIPDHVQADVGAKKSQLSPIIEASPHDDYFEERVDEAAELSTDQVDDMHSSQVTSRPPLTRGRTVDAMVKRLSQDSGLGRAPLKRLNSPAGLVAPGEERQHNNNMPFSYTRPTPGTPTRGRAAPTAEGGQVIYAEVVVGGGGGSGSLGKQTVHTQVPAGKQLTGGRVVKIESVSDEDEGLGLSMDGYRRSSADYLDSDLRSPVKKDFDSFDREYAPKVNGYRSQVRELLNNERDDHNSRSASRLVSDTRMDYGGNGLSSSVFKKEYVVHESSTYGSGNYILDPPGRGRADGMDSWKKEAMLETSRYENEFNRARDIDKKTPIKNNLSDSYLKSDNYEKEYNFSSKFVKNGDDHDLSYRSDRLKKDPLIEPHIINRSDLSSRRNRLESRIESHRKDRLLNTNFPQREKRDILLESKANETNKMYLSDHKNSTDTSFSNRRDFLNSQIDFENGRLKNDKKYESENLVRTNLYNESLTEVESHGKKDLFADSGIEMDYRKDSSGTVASKHGLRTRRNESPTRVAVNKWPSSNVTRVDLNGHPNGRLTDEEDTDNVHRSQSATKHSSYTKQVTSDSFVSARLVKEQRKTTEAIPSSTVLIRHYAPGRDSPDHVQELRRNNHVDVGQRGESPGRDWKQDKHSRRLEEQSARRREDEENAKDKDEVTRKEEKKKKEPEDVKTVDKKTEVKKVKKKQVTAMDKMRQLFSRSDTKTLKKNKKKEEKAKEEKHKEDVVEEEEADEDPVTNRYTEYKGGDLLEEDRDTSRTSHRGEQHRRLSSDLDEQQELGRSRERLATPSPSPPHAATLGRRVDSKSKDTSWFKSLDRRSSRPAAHKIEDIAEATTEDDAQPNASGKSLRFFGDTDAESVSVARGRHQHPPARRYKSNNNVSSNRLQVPQQQHHQQQQQRGSGLRNHHRHHRSTGDVATSSAESTTEGDSSQQSQKSVVYLHAATVGDIPNSNTVARSRRAQSREELSSVASSHRLQPQTRTVSRSISVLAPWRPRNFKDNMEVHYENQSPNRGSGKPPKIPSSLQTNGQSSTMSRVATRRRPEDSGRTGSQQKHKVGKAASVESLSRQDGPATPRDQATAKKRNLSTSVESLEHKSGTTKPHQSKTLSKKNSALNASTAELSNSRSYKGGAAKKIGDGKKNGAKLARSASMPKDTRSSGWFKLKSKKQAT